MKMLVFYRSREYTNAIISSTRYKLQNMDMAKGLDVDFINLDKRNYIKVLALYIFGMTKKRLQIISMKHTHQ